MYHIGSEFPDSFFTGEIEKVNPEELLKFLVAVSCEICDTTTKKQAIKNFKLLLYSLIRLASNNPNLTSLVDYLITSSFEIFSRLNMSDPVEYSVNESLNLGPFRHSKHPSLCFQNYSRIFHQQSRINQQIAFCKRRPVQIVFGSVEQL